MCGIVGWIDWQRDVSREEELLSKMGDALTHRGPDDAGQWFSPRAAFAHRRLIVVDPAGGGQPMLLPLGEELYVIVYNGELYNTEELRQELLSRGHRFRSHSDTEVLLHAYAEWKENCLERLNGIFAFAVWEEKGQKLFLARDRLGVKPLFYAQKGSAFLFASEIKALLQHPYVRPVIGEEGLAEILALGPARTPGHGVFKDIQELKPGWCLRVDRQGYHPRPYWQLHSEPHRDDFATTVETIRELLQDAITRQLVSDVPVCTLLSGGLDSSTISAFAQKAFLRSGQEPLRTFSVDYVDNEKHFRPSLFQPNPDAPWVQRVSSYLGTRHHDIRIDTPELVHSLKTAVRARDLPGMTDVDSSLLLFCQEIKKEATVALSGECADEVFGGYPWFHRPEMVNADTFPWARLLRERLRFLSPALKERIHLEEYVKERYRQALAEVPRAEGDTPEEARMREMFYLNLFRWMPTLLDRKDRMSMAVGLEVRVPFCDHRLVEYMWNVPWEFKRCDGQSKGLLRRALKGILPDDVLSRRKSPYPKTHNPAFLDACRQWALDILADPASPLKPLLNVEEVLSFAAACTPASDMPWFGQLMNAPQWFAYLGQVDTWLREYKVVIE